MDVLTMQDKILYTSIILNKYFVHIFLHPSCVEQFKKELHFNFQFLGIIINLIRTSDLVLQVQKEGIYL